MRGFYTRWRNMIIIRKFIDNISSLSIHEARELIVDLNRAIEEAQDHETAFCVTLMSDEGKEQLIFSINPFIKSAMEIK